jgi:dissimilatory sulfite reductase (desulfoviridin) alpha/beta subunit
VIDFWAENGLEHERCGEMIERIGLAAFLEGIGVEVDPNMIAHLATRLATTSGRSTDLLAPPVPEQC